MIYAINVLPVKYAAVSSPCLTSANDGTGGASLSMHSLVSATLGAAASAPLLMLRASMWTKEAHQRFPVLEELQRQEAEACSPVVRNMSSAQVYTLCSCDSSADLCICTRDTTAPPSCSSLLQHRRGGSSGKADSSTCPFIFILHA